ncbi:MAG: lipid A biosynthesis lauroyl acyltransferase [Rhizobiaceae bacterium]
MYRHWRRLRHAEYWIFAQITFALLRVLRRLPAHAAIDFMDRAARRVGPWLGRHKVAMRNLRAAFPEKSEAELQQIAIGMWGNMARLVAEYVFLEQIFDYVPDVEDPGLVEIDGRPRFDRLVAENKASDAAGEKRRARIFFTAHTGNFELMPIGAAAYGLEVTALFRPPNNPYIAAEVLKARLTTMGGLIPSKAGAVSALANILSEGGSVGMLIDQYFYGGPEVDFFGQKCPTSPLLPRLARQFDCDIYPTRCIRLPGGGYRLQLMEKIELPRNDKGKIDIEASCQMLNDIAEGWIREYPDQWMWFHKRWKVWKMKNGKMVSV